MSETKQYVGQTEHGGLRITQTRVSLDSVVYAFLDGFSPESIRQQFPVLSLEEVYGAITYYLANKAEVEQYLERQEKLWEELRQENERNPIPVVERLRALRSSKSLERR